MCEELTSLLVSKTAINSRSTKSFEKFETISLRITTNLIKFSENSGELREDI